MPSPAIDPALVKLAREGAPFRVECEGCVLDRNDCMIGVDEDGDPAVDYDTLLAQSLDCIAAQAERIEKLEPDAVACAALRWAIGKVKNREMVMVGYTFKTPCEGFILFDDGSGSWGLGQPGQCDIHDGGNTIEPGQHEAAYAAFIAARPDYHPTKLHALVGVGTELWEGDHDRH